MSKVDLSEDDGEGYFASISDLMVGILFVFLLMLTVFALNFRQAEAEQTVERQKYVELLDAEKREQQAADAERLKNAQLRDLLNNAVQRMKQEIEDRQQARDRLLNRLGQLLKDEGVTVTLDPDSGVLRLPESLLFEKGQSTLGGGAGTTPGKPSAREALQKISDALSEVLPCFVATETRAGCEARDRSTLEGVLIEGHSHKQPFHEPGRTVTKEESRDHNDRLSVERALTVFKELQQRNALGELKNANGIPLLAVSAYGDRHPVATGDTPEDYQKNRRIDLRFLLSSRTSDELRRLIEEIKPALGDTQ